MNLYKASTRPVNAENQGSENLEPENLSPKHPVMIKRRSLLMLSGSTMAAAVVQPLIAQVAQSQSAAADPETLRVALLPDESAGTVIQNNKPLENYLEKRLGKKIELVVTTDYSSMIEAARNNRLELAYFGPLSYVLAKSKGANFEPFAALIKDGKNTYTSVIITNPATGITTVKAIKGKIFAFGDQASTTSHLAPKSMLIAQGLQAGRDYKEVFLGAHDAVAIAVQNVKAQAGGLSRPIFDSLLAKGRIERDKVKVIAESKPIPQYPWTMRSGLNPTLKAKIRAAFLELKDESVLKPFKGEGFGTIADRDYNVIRDLAKVLKLDLATFSR
jgi:phosphonate transport system substrate-binding protein